MKTLSVFKVMALTLFRDRGAFAMSFLLPGLVYVIFALIFSNASGGDLAIRIAIADERGTATSKRLVKGLLSDSQLTRVGDATASRDDVRRLVRDGKVDVGLVVRKGGRGLSDLSGDGPAPIELIGDQTREIAVFMIQGALQKTYFSSLPDAAIRSMADIVDKRFVNFNAGQRIRLERGLEALATQAAKGEAPQNSGFRLDKLFERRDANAGDGLASGVAYYAGAVSMLFLLYTCLTGATSLLVERESGLLDRLAGGPGGIGVLLDGKFLFLVLQGFLQVSIIFAVAWLGFGMDVPAHLGPWAMTTFASALAAAGLAMFFVTLCRSPQQAHQTGQMLVIVLSALGGAMVPRFLMPPAIQDLGWLTPHTWALEAYSSIFWRGDGIEHLWTPWWVLAGIGLAGLFAAHVNARRWV
ncbi:MAG: ABC transporter permease [Pseudomonadota bacterium]